LPTYEQRKAAKAKKKGGIAQAWLRADEMVSEVYVDLVNGMTKSDIIEKITKGLYENQKRPLSVRSAGDYLDAAYRRMHYDFEAKAEDMRADLYSKLMTLYHDAIMANDRSNAIQVIDRIMKLTGCAIEKGQQNNIQVNAASSGVTVNFMFPNEEAEEDGL
jgi:hypothetical protein